MPPKSTSALSLVRSSTAASLGLAGSEAPAGGALVPGALALGFGGQFGPVHGGLMTAPSALGLSCGQAWFSVAVHWRLAIVRRSAMVPAVLRQFEATWLGSQAVGGRGGKLVPVNCWGAA